MKSKGKTRFWLALTIFSLVGQIAWVVENMYFNVFIYQMFNASAGDLSLMVAASAVAATLTTIFIGALSDKLGKRKIFICAGYLAWGISILSFALIRKDVISAVFGAAVDAASLGVSLVILMDCVMTFFGSSANDACFNAWLTDATDESNRGAAEGINAMMPLVAILAVFGGFMGFDLSLPSAWTTIFLLIGIVVSLIGVLGFFLIADVPVKEKDALGYFATILYGFRPSVVRRERGLYTALLAFALFGISIQIFMPYLIIYYEKSLAMADYVLIMAPAIVLAAVFTAFYGRRFDRVGYAASILPSLTLLLGGYVLLYLFPGVIPVTGIGMKLPVFFGSLLMMMGYLSGMAIFGAELRARTPASMAGRFQGLRIVGQVLIPGIVGPAIGAAVLSDAEMIQNSDGTESFLPNESIFLAAFVAAALLLAVLNIYFALKRKKGKSV